MNDKRKSHWGWRCLRWGLISVAILTTLAFGVITGENWRAKRAWDDYRAAAEARGERFDQSAYAGASVPDDQNFARAPVFAGIYSSVWDEQAHQWQATNTNTDDMLYPLSPRHSNVEDPYGNGDWMRARLTHWESWADYDRTTNSKSAYEFTATPRLESPAAEVLWMLTNYDAAIEGLRLACQRPGVQLGISDLSDQKVFSKSLEYLAVFKRFAMVLCPRAIAELADHQDSQGLNDVQTLLQLDDKLRTQRVLIVQLVSVAISAVTMQPIYEGLEKHRWNDAQIAELERALAGKDFLADYRMAIHGEQAYAVGALENLMITRQYQSRVDDGPGKSKIQTINLRFVPAAFFYQNELTATRLSDQLILPLVDVSNRVVSPAAVRQADLELSRQADLEMGRQLKGFSLVSLEGMTVRPSMGGIEKFAAAQTAVDLAQIACALERYRLAHGDYPESLDVLAPQYIERLPHDIINGQPLHYHRTEDGNFILYSVGWNEQDDGGKVVPDKSGRVFRDQGDWVWNSDAK